MKSDRLPLDCDVEELVLVKKLRCHQMVNAVLILLLTSSVVLHVGLFVATDDCQENTVDILKDVGPIGPDSAVYHRNKRYWNSGRFTVPPYCPPGCSNSSTPPPRPTECPPGSPGCDGTDSQMPPTRCPQGSPGCATKCLPGQPGCDSQNGGNPPVGQPGPGGPGGCVTAFRTTCPNTTPRVQPGQQGLQGQQGRPGLQGQDIQSGLEGRPDGRPDHLTQPGLQGQDRQSGVVGPSPATGSTRLVCRDEPITDTGGQQRRDVASGDTTGQQGRVGGGGCVTAPVTVCF